MSEQQKQAQPLTAVVIAGAVARGAYEAAAMAELLPRVLPDLSSTFFLGTSAGAINAALWARFAEPGRPIAEVGEAVKNVWASIDEKKVFGGLSTLIAGTVTGAARDFLVDGGLSNLVDTTPLRHTVERELQPEVIARNLAAGAFAGVGVAATFCGINPASDRTHLFLQGLQTPALAAADSGIDYIPALLTPEHILASSAVPVLFDPVGVREKVDGPIAWYIDGGVRLNTPIAPAIALGARRIIVISSHTASYPKRDGKSRRPSINDSIGQLLHSVLADGMIEDLRRLKSRNHLVEVAQRQNQPALTSKEGRRYERIPHIVVAPEPGQLAGKARAALDKIEPVSLRTLLARTADTLLRPGGEGNGRDEVLSYVLFDHDYFNRQFELGIEHARNTNDEWVF